MSAFVTNKGGGKLEVADILSYEGSPIGLYDLIGSADFALEDGYDYIGVGVSYWSSSIMLSWCSVIDGMLIWDADYKSTNPNGTVYMEIALNGNVLKFILGRTNTSASGAQLRVKLYKIKR